MPQSLAKVLVHIIFSTKDRYGFLKDEALRHEMYAYLATVLREYDSPSLVIGGVQDHVHILMFSFSEPCNFGNHWTSQKKFFQMD